MRDQDAYRLQPRASHRPDQSTSSTIGPGLDQGRCNGVGVVGDDVEYGLAALLRAGVCPGREQGHHPPKISSPHRLEEQCIG
ncbi:MAG: hypothetical protein U1E65_03490 [Myxococcota bacterium]